MLNRLVVNLIIIKHGRLCIGIPRLLLNTETPHRNLPFIKHGRLRIGISRLLVLTK